MGLKEYIARRLITTFITLLLVVSAIYFIFRLPAYLTGQTPADLYGFQRILENPDLGEAQKRTLINQLRRSMGIPPKGASFLTRAKYFFLYLKNMLLFNFGTSTTRPPFDIIARFLNVLPYTLILLGPATLFSILIGIYLGTKAGGNPGTKQDKAVTLTGLSLYSVPSYWLGPMLILIFAGILGVYPPIPKASLPGLNTHDTFYQWMGTLGMMSLPITALVVVSVGSWIYLMRNSLMDVITEDYIFTARAKGLDERTVLYRHAFRNAVLPIWTSIVLSIATMWTGVLITEQIFNIPGVGHLFVTAITRPIDYATGQTMFYFMAISVLFANLIADISYSFLDPRVQYD